jgi:cytochrome c553
VAGADPRPGRIVKARLALVALLAAMDVAAQPAPVQRCANCHGARGEGGLTGAPRIAGLPRAYFLEQLEAFAGGRRQNGVMTPLAQTLSLPEREALAAYYESLRVPTPPPQVYGPPLQARPATMAAIEGRVERE